MAPTESAADDLARLMINQLLYLGKSTDTKQLANSFGLSIKDCHISNELSLLVKSMHLQQPPPQRRHALPHKLLREVAHQLAFHQIKHLAPNAVEMPVFGVYLHWRHKYMCKNRKSNISPEQLVALNARFSSTQYLAHCEVVALAAQLGLMHWAVKRWFRKKRVALRRAQSTTQARACNGEWGNF